MNHLNIAQKLVQKEEALAVVGLGYVGLPIAVAFAKKGISVIGFDVNKQKVDLLKQGIDQTNETTKADLDEAQPCISYTSHPEELQKAKFIIVAVPTPIDDRKSPDLSPLLSASSLIGSHLSRGSYIVFESTVYPGATEEDCLPLIEEKSGLSLKNGDFFIGYSPERINPGDKEHTLATIVKIVSGQNETVCNEIGAVYSIVVEAGIHKAESIKVAEAAKVIENTQRDLNIALMNELSIIFEKLDIDTQAVLKAAGTKWNFLKFHPGLVGGHCIGVDPYYLTSKAEQLGYHAQVVLAGRRINDGMGAYVAQQVIKQMIQSGKNIKGSNIYILGLTFKENVPDFRNSRVVDVIEELKTYGVNVKVMDPYLEGSSYLGCEKVSFEQARDMDAIIVTTAHHEFKQLSLSALREVCKNDNGQPLLVDVRWVFDAQQAQSSGFNYWRV